MSERWRASDEANENNNILKMRVHIFDWGGRARWGGKDRADTRNPAREGRIICCIIVMMIMERIVLVMVVMGRLIIIITQSDENECDGKI